MQSVCRSDDAGRNGSLVEKFSLSKMICAVFVFCAATAIVSLAQTFTTLVSFDGTNGANPDSSLIQGTDGSFYGTTLNGGANGDGTVFKITPGGTLTTLHTFNGTDGESSSGGLVRATDGNFYGTTFYGGVNCGNCGTVFKITAGGTLTTLYNFCSQPNCTDGYGPDAGLVQGSDGNFYGTTTYGGVGGSCAGGGCGTVFKITPSGALTKLHDFDDTDGRNPIAGLVQGSDGNFYGATTRGGNYNGVCSLEGCGGVFKITPQGTLTTLHVFDGTDGANPYGGLVQGTDGNFYGTAVNGGANGYGTVFKTTPSGTLTTIYSFCSQQPNCADGGQPYGGLVQGTDGNFYGTTTWSGVELYLYAGTVFEISPGGALTTLHNFCSQSSCTDGYEPLSKLVQGTDGNFYGTTVYGGANDNCAAGGYYGCGTAFSVAVNPQSNPLQFVPLAEPCRAVDTRPEKGGGGPIQGGTFQNLPIQQEGNCNIPTSAAAYAVNVSVVPQEPLGYLTVWPSGQPRPLVSTLNSLDGRIKANAAIVPAGTNGYISVYATNTTNVILDVNGYFTSPGSTLAFYPLPPCRVADTRYSSTDSLGAPFLTGDQERDFPILNATSCNIPSTATAYSLNFSVVPHGPLGYMTVWPTGESRPTVSTLNDIPGTIIANAAIVAAGTGGEVAVYPTNDTDVIIDINGYFAAPGPGGLSLYGVQPCRVIDTRKVGAGQPFTGTLSPPVDVLDSGCGTSTLAQAYVFNASVVPYGALGYLTLWPNDGSQQPVVSTLNALDGSISSNMAIVPTASNESVNAYASGTTQLILDISSYFAP